MKIFVCGLFVLAVASAAPSAEENETARDKRGIFGEPGGLLTPHLHHDPIFGTHAHLPVLQAPLTAPLHTSFAAPLTAPLAAPLHAPLAAPLHAPLRTSLHAPLLSAAPVIRAPLLEPRIHAPLVLADHHHHDLLHHAPIIRSHIATPVLHGNHVDLLQAPILPARHLPPTVIRVTKTVHSAPIRYGW